MASDNLLHEFPSVSTQSWEDAIQKDLKGADYAKKLIWQSEEGLAVKPYYRTEDIADLDFLDSLPGQFPYLRGARASGNWRIREEVDIADPEHANRAAVHAVAAGAEEIAFTNAAIRNASDLGMLLANLNEVPVHLQNAGETLVLLLVKRLQERHHTVSVSAGFNPLTNLDMASEVIRTAPAVFVPFTIDASSLEESSATAVEEIGFALAAGVDYLAHMQSAGVDLAHAALAVEFSFAIGANYFFQIAKFRALRMVWARAVESFGCPADSARARISARTSRWNKTIYDPHVNVLRATTEAMSAALGGVDSITVTAFDECYKAPDEASRRLARNTQIILKHEALLTHVADPGAGSYILEVITDYLAREAWKLMQSVEAQGGYQKYVTEGKLAQAIQKSMAASDKAVSSRRRVFTGTNQFANAGEQALNRINPLFAAGHRRGAQMYESLRLRTERHAAYTGFLPQVLLAEFGDVKMRSARSTFAANLFACAGFKIDTQRFDNAAEIANCQADLIVLCSSDFEYLAAASDLVSHLRALGRTTPVIIAGNPESTEQLRAAGVADFIHIRSNPIDVLTNWQQQLGMKA